MLAASRRAFVRGLAFPALLREVFSLAFCQSWAMVFFYLVGGCIPFLDEYTLVFGPCSLWIPGERTALAAFLLITSVIRQELVLSRGFLIFFFMLIFTPLVYFSSNVSSREVCQYEFVGFYHLDFFLTQCFFSFWGMVGKRAAQTVAKCCYFPQVHLNIQSIKLYPLVQFCGRPLFLFFGLFF